MKKLASITAITTLCLGVAFATTPGPYIGVSAGFGGMNTNELDNTLKHQATFKTKEELRGAVFRIFAGYLWAIPSLKALQLGLEAGYNLYPDNKYQFDYLKWSYSGYNIDLLGVAKYYFGKFNLIAKAGGAYTSQKYRANNYGPTIPLNINKTKGEILPKIAFGVGFDITQHIGLSVLFSHVFGKVPPQIQSDILPTNSKAYRIGDVDTIQGAISYHFS